MGDNVAAVVASFAFRGAGPSGVGLFLFPADSSAFSVAVPSGVGQSPADSSAFRAAGLSGAGQSPEQSFAPSMGRRCPGRLPLQPHLSPFEQPRFRTIALVVGLAVHVAVAPTASAVAASFSSAGVVPTYPYEGRVCCLNPAPIRRLHLQQRAATCLRRRQHACSILLTRCRNEKSLWCSHFL